MSFLVVSFVYFLCTCLNLSFDWLHNVLADFAKFSLCSLEILKKKKEKVTIKDFMCFLTKHTILTCFLFYLHLLEASFIEKPYCLCIIQIPNLKKCQR